jgi:hypothetical protein
MAAPVILLAPAALEGLRLAVDYFVLRDRSEERRQQFELEMRAIELDRQNEAARIRMEHEVRAAVLDLMKHTLDRKVDGMVHVFDRTMAALEASQRSVDEQLREISELRYRGAPSPIQMVEMGVRERELQRNREALDIQMAQVGHEFGRLISHIKLQGPLEQVLGFSAGRIGNGGS